MKQFAAFCLAVGCVTVLGFRSTEPTAVAVEPIEIVRPVPKADLIDIEELARRSPLCDCGKKCDCLDCACGTRPEGEGKWYRHVWRVDGKRCEGWYCWYQNKLWAYSDAKEYYLLDDKGNGTIYRVHEPARAAATNSLVSRRTSTKGESGSCSSGGCSSGSCGVGRGRLGRWR